MGVRADDGSCKYSPFIKGEFQEPCALLHIVMKRMVINCNGLNSVATAI